MSTQTNYSLTDLAKLKIHLIGVGGAGMSGIARIMLAKGFSISGSDKSESAMLTSLKALGAEIFIGHASQNLGDAQMVIISSAINESNAELLAAKAKGLPIIARATALAWLMSESTSVAIAGTHGKTTTTAMLTVALQSAGLDPSFAIGGTINTAGTNAHSGTGTIFVAEADESDGSFLAYKPTGAIITNIELDHVDHFPNEDAVFAVFEQFVSSIKQGGFLVACGDDAGVNNLLKRIKRTDLQIYLYGKGASNDFRIDKIHLAPKGASSVVSSTGRKIGELNLAVAGEHNLLNGLAAFAAASALGAAETKVLDGLASFTGTKRRFELKGEVDGVKVIDDYGHHPTEIKAVLEATRKGYPNKTINLVFQPHRFTRTRDCFNDFIKALKMPDKLFLLDIYPAGERPIKNISTQSMIKAIANKKTFYLPDLRSAKKIILSEIKNDSIVILMGAGSIGNFAQQFTGNS